MLQLHVPVACSIHPPTHPSIFIASSHPSIHPSIHLHPLVNGVLIPLPLSSSCSSTDTPPDPGQRREPVIYCNPSPRVYSDCLGVNFEDVRVRSRAQSMDIISRSIPTYPVLGTMEPNQVVCTGGGVLVGSR